MMEDVMDYEEMMLKISDIMRQANRVRPIMTHEESVKAIRNIVTPKGEWEVVSTSDGTHFYGTHFCECSECQFAGDITDRFCRRCGADMRGDV